MAMKYFSKFGKVIDARIIEEKKKNKVKMIGFVLFQDERSVAKTLSVSENHVIAGEMVTCNRAMLREELKKAQIEEAKILKEKNKEERKRKKREKKKRRKERKKKEKLKLKEIEESRRNTTGPMTLNNQGLNQLEQQMNELLRDNPRPRSKVKSDQDQISDHDSNEQIRLKRESYPFSPSGLNSNPISPHFGSGNNGYSSSGQGSGRMEGSSPFNRQDFNPSFHGNQPK